MKKYVLIVIVVITISLRTFPACAQILMSKQANSKEQSSQTEEDSQEQSKDIGKAVKSPAKSDKPSPNGPFTTTNGSFSINLNNPKPKTHPVKTPQDNRHKHNDHDNERDDHRSHNYGYINIQNVYLPAVPAIIIPADFLSLSYNGETYYYNEGTFYQLNDQVLAPVKAPVGAIVSQIPADYSTIQVEGNVLYIYRDIFYKKIPEGFIVVETPEALRKVNP